MDGILNEMRGLPTASNPRESRHAKTQSAQRGRSVVLLTWAAILTGCLTTPTWAALPRNALPVDRMLLPPLADGRVKVTVALHVLNLSTISEVAQRFQLTGYLLAQWHDPRKTYQLIGRNDMYRMIALDSVWRPRLVIINVVEPRQTYEASLRVESNGVLSYAERFDAVVTSTFHLQVLSVRRTEA